MNETPKSEIKRFLKALFFILMGITILDQLIGTGLKYLYAEQKSGLLYRTSYAIDSTRADYIVLGSSRANHDYDPKIFELHLKSSFYNCGRDKQGLLYSCAVLSALLERYKPKGIIIDIRPDEFTQSDEGTLSTLLPYYHNKEIKKYVKFNSHFEDVKLISRIYPYNSLLTNLVVGLHKNWSEDYKGYIALNNLNTNDPIETMQEGLKTDSTKIIEFYTLLAKINKQNIPVMLVISPIRYNFFSSVTVNQCVFLTQKFGNITFLNFLNNPNWTDYKLYSDNNHLNNNGATRYSAILADSIMKIIK